MDKKNDGWKLLSIVLATALVTMGIMKVTEKKTKETAAVASPSVSASTGSTVEATDDGEDPTMPPETDAPKYPETTFKADASAPEAYEIVLPSVDASLDRAEADKAAANLHYGGYGPVVIQDNPHRAVSQYLEDSGLINVLTPSADGWTETDLSDKKNINKKFKNLYRVETKDWNTYYDKSVWVGDYEHKVEEWCDVVAFVTYDGTTSTIHQVTVDDIAFLTDPYIDEGMVGYMYN